MYEKADAKGFKSAAMQPEGRMFDPIFKIAADTHNTGTILHVADIACACVAMMRRGSGRDEQNQRGGCSRDAACAVARLFFSGVPGAPDEPLSMSMKEDALIISVVATTYCLARPSIWLSLRNADT